jgi:hypothetical protein
MRQLGVDEDFLLSSKKTILMMMKIEAAPVAISLPKESFVDE